MKQAGSRNALAFLMIVAAGLMGACGSREPRTPAERLARGRDIVDRMSARLSSAPALSVTTDERREEVTSNGKENVVTLIRETTVRRPDRLYSKVSGDRENEVWYDGVGVTVVLHKDKVFGQARAPETLDETLDAIHERFGVAAPVGDYMYSAPSKALLTDTTTGGWVNRETIDGVETDHLSFKDTGVNWDVWVPTGGDPLPRKAVTQFTDDRRLRKVELTFRDWNLAPQIAANRFDPTVPGDYEGIAILQRARVLRNQAAEEAAAGTAGAADKK